MIAEILLKSAGSVTVKKQVPARGRCRHLFVCIPPQRLCLTAFFLAVAQIEHTHVAELNARAMAAEADIAVLVEQSRMVLVVNRIWVVVRTVGRNVMSLAGFAYVSVEYYLAVHGNRDVVAHNADFL